MPAPIVDSRFFLCLEYILMDFKILPFELKSASGDGSTFEGYCNVFNNIDAAQEIVAPGAFKDTIAQFLDVGFIGGLNHNWDSPIGSPTTAVEDAKGLFISAKISPTTHGKDCMILLKDKVIKKMSIGYRVLGDEYLEDGEAVAAYWDSVKYTPNAQDIAKAAMGARLLTRLHLYEGSPVSVPANSMADITGVKRYDSDEMIDFRDIEKRLRDVGQSQKAAKIFISVLKAIPALYQRDVEEANTSTERTDTEEPPTAEPEVPDREPASEAETEPIEAVTQEPPTKAVPVIVDLASSARSLEVSAHYASFLALRAKYGLDGEPKHYGNSTRTVAKTGAEGR